MALIVQKYGGSSIADAAQIMAVARRIAASRERGNELVVVVSAPGKTTDDLYAAAREISDKPPLRELAALAATGEQISMTLLAMALCSINCPAVSYSGAQLGICTTPGHTGASINSLNVRKLQEDIAAGRVPVIAGFQGVNEAGEITTLGRGGSDTTAAAVAAALNADVCEILTDVPGVYTADPQIIPTARKLDRISYEEMFEMDSRHGGVVHPRAVIFGMKYGIPIHVRHGHTDEQGTFIIRETPDMAGNVVSGVAIKPDICRINIRNLPAVPGVAAELFGSLADNAVPVTDINHMRLNPAETVLSFTVELERLPVVENILELISGEIGCTYIVDTTLVRVSAVGVGMRSHPGVVQTILQSLAEAHIDVLDISSSEIRVSVLVARERGEEALRVLHDSFGLSRETAVA